MSECERCHNEYDKAFNITMAGKNHTFDCFECAIQELAPECHQCGCKIIGHGMENNNVYYCCAHCAKQSGVYGIQDRV